MYKGIADSSCARNDTGSRGKRNGANYGVRTPKMEKTDAEAQKTEARKIEPNIFRHASEKILSSSLSA